MIEDIVALPRRLRQVKSDAKISSETTWCLPMPMLPLHYGFCSPDDSVWLPYGVSITLPTGKDTWFRYKIIEVLPAGVFEYFCLTDQPIDIARPGRSRKATVRCLWVTVKEHKTQMTKKYIFWRNILSFTRYETEDSVVDSPVEAVIANEIRTLAGIHGAPELMEDVKAYPRRPEDVLVSESRFSPDEGLGLLTQLAANIREFNNRLSLWGMESWDTDIRDIYRGVDLPTRWSNFAPIRTGSLLPFVQYGPITLGEFLHLIGPFYSAHNFQYNFKPLAIEPYTEISIESDDSRKLFDILKYVEKLPYSDFNLTVERAKKGCEMQLFRTKGVVVRDQETDAQILADTVVTSLRPLLDSGFPDWTKVEFDRSWAEEMFIVVEDSKGSEEHFYFDLAVASICSRALVRDYCSACFAIGL